MKKDEKVAIIKWYIRDWCGRDDTQTIMSQTDDLDELEKLVMKDRCGTHVSDCSTCWHDGKDGKRCFTCRNRSNYTFPYGYWYKMCERRGIEISQEN